MSDSMARVRVAEFGEAYEGDQGTVVILDEGTVILEMACDTDTPFTAAIDPAAATRLGQGLIVAARVGQSIQSKASKRRKNHG